MASLRQQFGTLLFDRPRLAWTLFCPRLARWLGKGWESFHNRDEMLVRSPNGPGYDCRWKWTTDLNFAKVFPGLGRRLMGTALAEWPIDLAEAPTRPDVAGPLVSFIIGHRGEEKIPHLQATVRSILSQQRANVECVVIEQSSESLLAGRLAHSVRHVLCPPPGDMPYARAWAFNRGAREARGEILVFHDNDILVPTRYADQVIRTLARGAKVARLQRFVFYLTREQTERVFADGRLPPAGPPECVRQNCEGHTLAVERNAYFALGGHDESFIGWGGEDNEMFDRCRAVSCYPYGYLPFVHLYHTPQPRPADPRRFTSRLEARLAVPAPQRIAELAERPSGQLEGPYPAYRPGTT